MARESKISVIDNKIKRRQEKLFRLKEQSDVIAKEIEELIEEKEALRKEELIKEISLSDRTYEEIVEFLRSAPTRKSTKIKAKRTYTKGK